MNTIVYSLWSELHDGTKMPMGEIRERFRQVSLPTALGVLQRMDFLLSRAERPDGSLQDKMGVGLLGDKLWQDLLRREAKRDEDPPPGQRRPFFWHTALVLNSTKLSLLVSPDTTSRPEDLSSLGEAILGLSDYLESDMAGEELARDGVCASWRFRVYKPYTLELPKTIYLGLVITFLTRCDI